MQILIPERICPFSHLPGTSTLLPGSLCRLQIYPCLIRVFDPDGQGSDPIEEIKIFLKGPCQPFTLFNDLERGRLTVSGKSAEGWFRYHLFACHEQGLLYLSLEKAPEGRLLFQKRGSDPCILLEKERSALAGIHAVPLNLPARSRLFLGCHKQQDWDLIQRRGRLDELLPLVFRLGQLLPALPSPPKGTGTFALLEQCQEALSVGQPEKGERLWSIFLKGCFIDFLVPQLSDSLHLGLVETAPSFSASALPLLTEGSRLIQRLFVAQESGSLSLLPYLLPSLHCGRLINVSIGAEAKLSLEWTKKKIRRMVLWTGKNWDYALQFRPHVQTFRMRRSLGEKGKQVYASSPLSLENESCYFFDHFL